MNTARFAVMLGHFGLLALWIVWTVSDPRTPKALVLAVTALPLSILVRGMLHDRRGSFIWLGLLSLVYFIHGVGAATDAGQRLFAALEIALSLSLFGGCLARLRTKETG